MRKKYTKVLFDNIRRHGVLWPAHLVDRYIRILLSAGLSRPLTGPLSGVIMLTYRCNHRCTMCDFPQRVRPEKEFSTEQVRQLIDEFASMGTLGISLYGGEPLLRPDVAELLSYAGKKRLLTHLTTNGWLLNQDQARELVKSGLDLISISLDSVDPVANDRQRGVKGAFLRAKQAITFMVEEKKNQKAKTRIAVTTTIAPGNMGEIVPLAKLVRELGADAHTIFESQPVETLDNSFNPEEILELRKVNDTLIELKQQDPDFLDNSWDLLDINRKLLSGIPVRFKCFTPYTDLFVDPYGNVFTCNYFLGMNRPMGKITPGTMTDFWYSPEARQARKKLASCNNCNYMCHREVSALFNRVWPGFKPTLKSW